MLDSELDIEMKDLSPAEKRRLREKRHRYETILSAAMKFFL